MKYWIAHMVISPSALNWGSLLLRVQDSQKWDFCKRTYQKGPNSETAVAKDSGRLQEDREESQVQWHNPGNMQKWLNQPWLVRFPGTPRPTGKVTEQNISWFNSFWPPQQVYTYAGSPHRVFAYPWPFKSGPKFKYVIRVTNGPNLPRPEGFPRKWVFRC